MFIEKSDKKVPTSRVLLLISFLFFCLSFYFLLGSRIYVSSNEYLYQFSYLDLILKSGLSFSNNVFFFPKVIKFLVSLSIMGSISSLFFLFIKKKKESFIFSTTSIISPLCVIVLNSFNSGFKLVNTGFVIIHLLISIITVFLFLSIVSVESAYEYIFKFISVFCIFILITMVLYLLISGLPAIFKVGIFDFLFGTKWNPSRNLYGILPFILCSIAVTIGSILLGVPIGVFTSICLAEFTSKKIARVINFFIKILAGIPSVVFGFFGMLVVIPLIKKISCGITTGDSLLSAIIILSIMILPTIVSISEESIKAVPKDFLEASLALGVSKTRSIFKVVVPAAKEGIISGVFLGVGKALGETMAVIMVSGNAANMPSLLKPSRFLTTSMALEFAYASGLHRQVLFAIGLVLFVIICIVNISFSKFFKKTGPR